MPLVIVPVYAALLALLFVLLSVNVIRIRRQTRQALGSGGNPGLERRIRVHANFAEYVPLALLLLAFAEFGGAPGWLLHALCLALLFGRALHGWGVARLDEDVRFRIAGMTLTFASLLTTAFLLLALAFIR